MCPPLPPPLVPPSCPPLQSVWFIFPMLWLFTHTGLIRSVLVEEWLWCVGDLMGKVLFSSSLLQVRGEQGLG